MRTSKFEKLNKICNPDGTITVGKSNYQNLRVLALTLKRNLLIILVDLRVHKDPVFIERLKLERSLNKAQRELAALLKC